MCTIVLVKYTKKPLEILETDMPDSLTSHAHSKALRELYIGKARKLHSVCDEPQPLIARP